MNEERFWLNSGTTLFSIIDSQPKYLPRTGISKIEWLTGDPIKGAKATIVLHGQMPAASHLFYLRDGVNLEVAYREYGEMNRYDARNVIAKFTNCEIINWWVDNLVVTYMDLSEVVTLFVRIQADFTILEGKP